MTSVAWAGKMLEAEENAAVFFFGKRHKKCPNAQCMGYLPTKLGSFGGKCR